MLYINNGNASSQAGRWREGEPVFASATVEKAFFAPHVLTDGAAAVFMHVVLTAGLALLQLGVFLAYAAPPPCSRS
ncbi:unnamed protein product [Spirodela intermedia]|uniref:Uncharacterized protein n=1 Tax=Spirodela intermedia TaxID=51605 RepID=A0A7I8JF46_SPIIN|nr:unnamed protein product [Spirodela intermedia]CAA2634855.1 unnamed protein product [Spirodela intermedia]CAA6668551.1 unnamed protein product [Spirodela intermedia]CAA6673828.1 unnamed protein product [Spirodela intermedia]